jgi:hypothetical protein
MITVLEYGKCKRGLASLNNLSPLPPSLSKGRGSEGKRGGFTPSLKPLPPLLDKERGTKGVR